MNFSLISPSKSWLVMNLKNTGSARDFGFTDRIFKVYICIRWNEGFWYLLLILGVMCFFRLCVFGGNLGYLSGKFFTFKVCFFTILSSLPFWVSKVSQILFFGFSFGFGFTTFNWKHKQRMLPEAKVKGSLENPGRSNSGTSLSALAPSLCEIHGDQSWRWVGHQD